MSVSSRFARTRMFVWVAGHATRRDNANKNQMHPGVLYSKLVRQSLADCHAADIGDAAPPKEWSATLSLLDRQVLALALLRPSFTHDVEKLLSSRERELVDYWSHTRFADATLVFSDVLEVMPLREPTPLYTTMGAAGIKGIFGTVTGNSLQRIMQDIGPISGDASFAELMETWCARHGLGELLAHGCEHSVVAMLPLPHAVLTQRGVFQSFVFLFPIATKLRGIGLSLVKPLWSHFPLDVLRQGSSKAEYDGFCACVMSERSFATRATKGIMKC